MAWLFLQGCASNSDSAGGEYIEETLSLAEGYEYIGCFHDKSPMEERDMALRSKKEFAQNKPSKCAARCAKEAGATFFGLQNGGL